MGPAKSGLEALLQEHPAGTFDFCFIDADKLNYDNYYELALKLIRKGGIIAIDNTIWGGKVLQSEGQSQDTIAIQKLNDKLVKDDRIDISLLLIGDGLTLCFKK